MNELDLFAAVIAIADPAEQDSFLDRECEGRPELRQRLSELIAAHRHSRPVLDRAEDIPGKEDPPQLTSTLDYPHRDLQPGSVVADKYKLLERIGEGGMGEVWVADQMEPIKRRIAIKLIKPGMDSRSVLARFEAERQALALMDHPNIARVFDAGTSSDGRPFFVMELVKGTPITEFCDARRLTPKQRLELFVPVCQAIQHAHTKGIIHRDIKPSNVLVALHDERPVPKVIDFGVAKAIGQQLTEMTVYTGFGSLVGTPAYMAPEQATFNQLDIDTRADVYALGVLLYELLAGSPPIEKERLKKAAIDEVLRLVRDEEPPRPSQRLSTSQAKANIAATRQSDPIRLAQFIRGELDWIVMKALEKDRNRRFETANGFAADVQRYLAGEQVLAVPPSTAYRLRKFARKNRAMLTTVTAFVGLLLTAATISGWLAVKARRAEAVAKEKRIEAEENAKKAKENEDMADRFAMDLATRATQLESELQRSELTSASRQIDLDLMTFRTDDRAGLLRLCRTSSAIVSSLGKSKVSSRVEFNGRSLPLHNFFQEEVRQLREFVTAAVLVNGQNHAPLLPPVTHAGDKVIDWHFSASSERLLTHGQDGTAQLWNVRTTQPVAVLRNDQEQVIRCGLSPDGQTAFTDAPDGIVRLWNTTDGSYRAETESRPAHVTPESRTRYAGSASSTYRTADVTHLSNNRLITRSIAKGFPEQLQFTGPVELWDSQTGRLIARYEDQGSPGVLNYDFIGDGQWITAFERGSDVAVFSAVDGRQVGKLSHPAGETVTSLCGSPSGQRIVTIARSPNERHLLWFWNTSTWQKSVEDIVLAGTHRENEGRGNWTCWSDELVSCRTLGFEAFSELYQAGQAKAVGVFLDDQCEFLSPNGDLARLNDGEVYSTQNWQRLMPPFGHKYHPSLAMFARDGRFVATGSEVIDTKTEKQFSFYAGTSSFSVGFVPRFGIVRGTLDDGSVRSHLVPSAEKLDIPLNQLELWTQVAVRGELGRDGEFVKWDENTWERKRQELAARPAPIPDFPFPGYVASDKLHWLRAEYHDAKSDADKLRWASELIRRAEEIGDRIEAARWRAEQKRLSTVPAPGEKK